MDADLQHFPEDLPQFLAKLEEGYDIVCGWRHQRRENALRCWPSRAANALIRNVTGLPIHDFGTTYRAYRSDLVRHLKLLGEQHRFVPALAHMVGAKVAEIPIANVKRPHGASSYGIGRTLSVALDILHLYFAKRYLARPLKAFGKLALALFSAGFVIFSTLIAYDSVRNRDRHSSNAKRVVPPFVAFHARGAPAPACRNSVRGACPDLLRH